MWQKLNAYLFAAFVAVLHPALALAQAQDSPSPRQWYGPGPGHMWGDGYGFWWGGPILMILFWLLVIAAVVAVVSFIVRGGSRGYGAHMGPPPWHAREERWADPANSALQILNERFARGEIQKPEYEEKKSALVAGMRR